MSPRGFHERQALYSVSEIALVSWLAGQVFSAIPCMFGQNRTFVLLPTLLPRSFTLGMISNQCVELRIDTVLSSRACRSAHQRGATLSGFFRQPVSRSVEARL